MSVFIRLLKILLVPRKMTVADQLAYVETLEQKYGCDIYERVYLQYSCIFCNRFRFFVFLLNIISFFIIPVLLVVYAINSYRYTFKSNKRALLIMSPNKSGIKYSYEDKFPFDDIYKRFGNIEYYKIKKYPEIWAGVLNYAAFRFWLGLLLRYPLNLYMNATCLIAIMNINRIIVQYRPETILNGRQETNHTSSLVTGFCESLGVTYELFMHGDLIARKEMAFSKFSKVYVWDRHYIELFKRLHSYANEYIIFKPKMFEIDKKFFQNKVYVTYYLSGTNSFNENVAGIIEILASFVANGKSVRIRPHPRWTDLQLVKTLCMNQGVIVEDYKALSVEDSLFSSEYAAGFYSTVLSQAYFADIPVVIDDVTNPEAFDELLVQSDYILLKKKHYLLSEFMQM